MYGERIKLLRSEREMTQAQLAAALDMGDKVSTLRAWELEYSQPNIENLILLSDFFGVTIDYLAGRSTDRQSRGISSVESLIHPLERGYFAETAKKIIDLFNQHPRNVLALCEPIDAVCDLLDWQVQKNYELASETIDIDFNDFDGSASATVHDPSEELRELEKKIFELNLIIREQTYSSLAMGYSETAYATIDPNSEKY